MAADGGDPTPSRGPNYELTRGTGPAKESAVRATEDSRFFAPFGERKTHAGWKICPRGREEVEDDSSGVDPPEFV